MQPDIRLKQGRLNITSPDLALRPDCGLLSLFIIFFHFLEVFLHQTSSFIDMLGFSVSPSSPTTVCPKESFSDVTILPSVLSLFTLKQETRSCIRQSSELQLTWMWERGNIRRAEVCCDFTSGLNCWQCHPECLDEEQFKVFLRERNSNTDSLLYICVCVGLISFSQILNIKSDQGYLPAVVSAVLSVITLSFDDLLFSIMLKSPQVKQNDSERLFSTLFRSWNPVSV